jgi:hypothetical protein
MPRLLYPYQSSSFTMVSFMPRLLYNYQSSPLEWSASCLLCFIITKSPL